MTAVRAAGYTSSMTRGEFQGVKQKLPFIFVVFNLRKAKGHSGMKQDCNKQ